MVRIAARHPNVRPDSGLGALFLDWFAGCILVYLTLFGIGNLLFGRVLAGLLCVAGAALAVAFLAWHLNRRGFESVVGEETETKTV